MDAQTINQNYDLLTLAMCDTKLKHAGRFWIGPCPFCGGRDRFNLMSSAEGWRWFCRKCGDGKYHGAIDYIMRRDNLDFKQAIESLGGNVRALPRAQAVPWVPDITLPDQTWQEKTLRYMSAAADYLLGPAGEPGRRYLQERGISLGTIYLYLLGLDPNKYDSATRTVRPAIVIPWFDISWAETTVTSVKYRFIDELARDPKHRYTSGGKPIIFGLHAASGHNVLILVEGEINCMSIMQVSARDTLDICAVSYGSQSGSRASILQRVAKDYRRVIVWADDPIRAADIRSSLDLAAGALCSPEIDGQKYDANTLLQQGMLSDFLREVIQ